VAPGQFQRGAKLRFAQRAKRRARPAPPAPGVVEGNKGVGRDGAFERLLVGREFDVRGQFVRREGREGDARLERAAVEMGVFRRAVELQGDPAEVRGVGHEPSTQSLPGPG